MDKEASHLDLMTRAAWYYYNLDLTQSEVASELNISRQKVQRLIQKAKDMGIVQIQVSHPDVRILEVERDLTEKYSLENSIVVPSIKDEDVLESIGKAGSFYVKQLIKNTDWINSIGMGWGATMHAFASQLDSFRVERDLEVVTLVGNLLKDTAVNPFSIAGTVAKKIDASCYNLWAPSIVQDKERAAIFKSEPWIKKALEKTHNLDLAIVSIGQLSKEATLRELGYLTENDVKKLKAKGAVGDILSQFFDRDGKLVDTNFHDRVIASPVEKLNREDRIVIGMAGTKKKTTAISGALKGGYIDTLVTDEGVAKSLL